MNIEILLVFEILETFRLKYFPYFRLEILKSRDLFLEC